MQLRAVAAVVCSGTLQHQKCDKDYWTLFASAKIQFHLYIVHDSLFVFAHWQFGKINFQSDIKNGYRRAVSLTFVEKHLNLMLYWTVPYDYKHITYSFKNNLTLIDWLNNDHALIYCLAILKCTTINILQFMLTAALLHNILDNVSLTKKVTLDRKSSTEGWKHVMWFVVGLNAANLHQDGNVKNPHPPALVILNSFCDYYEKDRPNTWKELDMGKLT